MLEGSEPRTRIISAALRLAKAQSWRDLSLARIAAEVGVPLADFRREFQSKAQILSAFSKSVDEEVLGKFDAPSADAARDRLFDVILTRFETLQPYKPALRQITESSGLSSALSQARPALKSAYWMLAAAGVSGEGGRGLLRVKGLLGLYSSVFAIWLEDDDPGMARTMAALDRGLRRGESLLRGVERIRAGFESVGRAISCRSNDKNRESPGAEEAKAPPEPEARPQQV